MKTVFSNLLAFCLGLFICVAIIACANDTDDYSENTIEVLSSQIATLAERITSVEKNIQNSALPKVLSTEATHTDTEYGEVHRGCYSYDFDNQGRIVKITLNKTDEVDSNVSNVTEVTNVNYDKNECTLVVSDSGYTSKLVVAFDDNDISNIGAVNNLIVSLFTERP